MAQRGGHRFDTGAHDVVEGVLLGQGPSRSLGMRPKRQRFGILGVELLDHARPQGPRRAHLGYLHEKVLSLRPEKRQPRRKRVDVDPRFETGADVLEAVGQSVGHFQIGRRSRLLHVVAGDGNGIELGHVPGGESEDVGDDAHRGSRGIDVGVAHHVFLENVVLNGAGELLDFDALLLGGHDIKRQDRQNGPVHRHGNRNPVQRNLLEKDFHVLNGIHRHPRLPYVRERAGMIGIITPMRRQIEGDRQPLLAGGYVAPIEGVALFGRGKASVLPDRPGTREIHRTVRAAQIGRQTRHRVQILATGRVARRAERLEINVFERLIGPLFGRKAGLAFQPGAPVLQARGRGRALESNFGEIRKGLH